MRQFTLCISEFIQEKKKCVRRTRFFFEIRSKAWFRARGCSENEVFRQPQADNRPPFGSILLILCNALGVEVAADRILRHDGGEILHGETLDRLTAQLVIRDDLDILNGCRLRRGWLPYKPRRCAPLRPARPDPARPCRSCRQDLHRADAVRTGPYGRRWSGRPSR